jgi:hypothetical protein
MMEKKNPLLEKRAKILSGETKDFTEYLPAYDKTCAEITEIVAGIIKTEEDLEAEKE